MNSSRHVLIAIVFFGITFSLAMGKDFPEMRLDGNLAVAVPIDYFTPDSGVFRDRGVTKFWAPDVDTARKAEARLARYLTELRESTVRAKQSTATVDHLIANLGTQRRQYVGIVIGTRRVLHINLLPAIPKTGQDPFAHWRQHYIVVDDGGADFWTVDFDPEKLKFSNFSVNGRG